MKYDFNSIPDRSSCGSAKWNAMPGASTERVPLSTADMEFPTAPEIVDALSNAVKSDILGYTEPTESYYNAVCSWMKRRHNFDVTPEQIVLTPGVVFALGVIIEALSEPGDEVIIINPVYYPFDMAVLAKGRKIIYSEMKLEGTKYTIDYDDLEEKAARSDAKLLLFCNPHNPVGRVWGKDELERVVDICYKNNVFIIDDEIHNDLIMPGYNHTVMATLSEKASRITAVCTAPSKTFNLAGMQCSNIIVQDPVACSKVRVASLMTLNMHLNCLAYTACEAAYNHAEAWLDELLEVIDGNAKYIENFMSEHFPEITVFPLEGTYLQWWDCRKLGMTHVELERLMQDEAGLWLDEGYIFGSAGRGFERINIACSRLTIERSLDRFKAAVEKQRAIWAESGKPYHKTLKAGDRLENFVYDTKDKTGLRLEETIKRPTLIFFSRYYSCAVCQTTLNMLKQNYRKIRFLGFDVKVVIQSTQESVADSDFPFDLICDPEAKLYDMYNVFEADSTVAMVAESPALIEAMGGVKSLAAAMFSTEESEGRSRQLPAVFAVGKDMKIKLAHYGKTLDDMPSVKEMLSAR